MIMKHSGCSQYFLLSALVATAQAFMVRLANGSVVPLSMERRGPDDGIPLKLVNHNDVSYLTTVLMGTPFQEVEMAPSLSQNFISVASVPPGVSSSAYYNQAISSSYKPLTDIGTIPSISGGTINGRFAGEYCTLKALNSAIFAYNASVCLTDSSVTDALYPIGAKGVLGYGVKAPASSPPNASLIPTLLGPNFTGAAVCGIELNHMDDPVPDGIFTMAAVDRSAFTGEFTNVQVPSSSPVSWSVPLDTVSYMAGGTSQSVAGLLASVDVYHNVIQVTTDMATQIYAGVPGSQAVSNGVWSLPCTSSFPITLTFAGKPFTISERDTIVKQSGGTCVGAITGGAQSIAKVGAPFMRNYYTQFGVNGTSVFVGFATKKVRAQPAVVTTTLVKPTTVTASNPASTGSASSMNPQDAILFSMLAVASMFVLNL